MSWMHDAAFQFPESIRNKTWTSAHEQYFTRHLSDLKDRPLNCLEIGSCEGASAIWLACNILLHPESRLTCVELQRRPELEVNLLASGVRDKVEVVYADSKNIRSHLPDNSFDFVYVDACHAAPETAFDTFNAFWLCRPDGLVCCDDYGWPLQERGSSPKAGIDGFMLAVADRVHVLEKSYQVWFRKKAS